jgi:PAS domain S-box-containing protein
VESLGHARDTDPDRAQILRVGDAPDLLGDVDVPLNWTNGIDTASVSTATEALGSLEREQVSCVITAASLPDVDVLTFLDGVRAISPDVPFVVVSETADPELASEVLSYEATDFVDWRGQAHQRRQLARRVENLVTRYRATRTAEWTSAYLDALVHQAPDAILTVDGSGEIVFANRAIEEVFGYTSEELVGRPLTTLIPDRLREAHVEGFDRYRRTGARTLDWDYIELPGLHEEGHEVPLALSFRELAFDDRQLFSAVVRDVTERKRAEDERELLHATTRSVAAADTFLDGLEAAITEVCDATDWAYGEAWVPSADVTHLERTDAAYTVSEEYESFKRVSKTTSFESGEGLPGQVWESSEPVWMENVAALGPDVFPRTDDAEAVGLKAALGVPIAEEDGIVAVLAFYMPEERSSDGRLVDIVTTVATELGELIARKRAEDELKYENEFTEGALNALPDMFFTLDQQGRLVRWNDKVVSVTGYDEEELASSDPTDFFPDEQADCISEVVDRIFDEGEARIEAPLRTVDGREIPYEFTGALLEDDDGEPLGIAGIGRDITDRKRREAELEASREKFRKLVETAPDAIFIVDTETGIIVDTNEGAERLLGKSREEIVGMHQSELHPREEADRYRRIFEEHVESSGGVQDDDDYYVVHDDGHEVPVEISAGITEIGDRTLNQAVFRDVTDRKRREETLATLREVTRDLISAESKRDICDIAVSTARDILDLPITGIHLYDEDDRVLRPVATTPNAEELFGEIPTFEGGESLAWQVYSSGDPELYNSISERSDAYNPETPVETEMILPLAEHGVLMSGSRTSEHITEVELDLAKILAANTEAALDRADREQTIERQRDQLQAELDEVFERIDDGFFALDDQWRFTYVNERAERILGDLGGDLLGDVIWETLPEIRNADASEAFHRAVETQDPVSHEEYVGALGAWFEFHAYPSESGLSVYVRDISDRKHREQRLEQQNERLESFASMLAHELRNPLSIAQIYLQMAEDGDESAFARVADALDRIEDMIDVLLVMTRGGDPSIDAELVSLGEAASEAWADVAADRSRLEVETDGQVEVESHHLQHLLQNLLQNAVEHGSTSQRPKDDDSAGYSDDGVTVRIGTMEDGFYVEDNGEGIPEADRERIFEAGYSSDDTGIGLGLTFIAQLAEIYDWECNLAESEEGGARFEFWNVDVAPSTDS